MGYQYIILEKEESITTLWLNRPEVRNAFHEEMILEIIQGLDEVASDPGNRILILRGKGPAFCAGADLNWMKKAKDYSYEENLAESLKLSECLRKLYEFPRPTIAIIHGAAYGGANGLLAACDYVLAIKRTYFALSEVNLGLIPACIAPYIVKRMGETRAKSIMLRGNRIESKRAVEYGLIDYRGPEEECNKTLDSLMEELLSSGPKAVLQTKKLIHRIANEWSLDEAQRKTAEWISKVRMSEEGQEGMTAFFEKRKPNWIGDE